MVRLGRLGIPSRRPPSAPDGRVGYAIGDIHGCDSLLKQLLELIEADVAALGTDQQVMIVFLGDYIDRGPDSKGVIERVRALKRDSPFEVRTIKGNHEDALLAFLSDPELGPAWARHGGLQTLISYDVTPPHDLVSWTGVRDRLVEALGDAHVDFLLDLELMVTLGDYAFVHAGVRPGRSLADQSARDLLWIRDDFLSTKRPFEKVIVHGHTCADEAFLGPHRIGIDTGAYASGRLTAIRLRGQDQSLIQARSFNGGDEVGRTSIAAQRDQFRRHWSLQ